MAGRANCARRLDSQQLQLQSRVPSAPQTVVLRLLGRPTVKQSTQCARGPEAARGGHGGRVNREGRRGTSREGDGPDPYGGGESPAAGRGGGRTVRRHGDRKSTRLNSSHL